jgi:hypothetical protein
MSWIKPNFLWMMYRSGWATKPGQEAILAIRIAKSHFEQILAGAVHSSFKPDVYPTHAAWQDSPGQLGRTVAVGPRPRPLRD